MLRSATVLALVISACTVFHTLERLSFEADYASIEELWHKRPALADGCYHVFLDVGANLGVHGRFLLEPDKYPLVPRIHQIFNEYFGVQRDNRDICVFEIEANPVQYPKIEAKVLAYSKIGWRYHLIKAAASDHEGTLQFWHNHDEENQEWGFSAKKLRNDSVEVQIPTMRLASWMLDEIVPRRFPLRIYGNYSDDKKATVVMKMDIEGSEYLVLPDLIVSGAICHIDFVFGEDHSWMAPMVFEGASSKSDRPPAERVEEVDMRRRKHWILESVNITDEMHADKILATSAVLDYSRNCRTKFSKYDTEKYLFDRIPLPTPEEYHQNLD